MSKELDKKNNSLSVNQSKQLANCKNLHQKLKFHFGSLPFVCQNLLSEDKENEAKKLRNNIPIERSSLFPFPLSSTMVKRDSFLKPVERPGGDHSSIPFLDTLSHDFPIKIDAEKGRPLSTTEIVKKHLQAQREARIQGALASDVPSSALRKR